MSDPKIDEADERAKDGYRILFIDPDFRRQPKTQVFCCVCQKDIKGEPKFFLRLVDGMFAVHPEDEHMIKAGYKEDYGTLPVGPECARRLGKKWLKSST